MFFSAVGSPSTPCTLIDTYNCQYTGSIYGTEKEAATARYEKRIAAKYFIAVLYFHAPYYLFIPGGTLNPSQHPP